MRAWRKIYFRDKRDRVELVFESGCRNDIPVEVSEEDIEELRRVLAERPPETRSTGSWR